VADDVDIVCPRCRHRGTVPNKLIGVHVDCPNCGQPFVAKTPGRPRRPSGRATLSKRGNNFPALRAVAAIHKAAAVVALIGGVIALLMPRGADASVALAVLAWTLLAPLFLWGTGELILVFLHIERNTRRAASLLQRGKRSRDEPGAPPDRRGA
jgi:hypothetical protein